MALLNLSRVVASPFFSNVFSVTTRAEAVGANGRPTITEGEEIEMRGTVLPLPPNKLTHRDDGSYADRGIEVWAVTPINPLPPTDIVIYLGERYLVTAQDNYTQFGQGFTHITAEVETASITRL